MDDDLDVGRRVRTELFGRERVATVFSPQDELTQTFQRLMTSACFGKVWGDDRVPRHDRSLITISILGAQHRFKHFEAHTRLALRNGCTREQLMGVVQHLYTYCGAPTGVEAYEIVRAVCSEPDTLDVDEGVDRQ